MYTVSRKKAHVEETDHWGGVKIRVCFDWQTLQESAQFLDQDGKNVMKGKSLYPFVDTLGELDKAQITDVGGGKDPIDVKEGPL